MTPKEQAAMQQALIYLDAIINGEGVKPYELEGTAFTLREALDNSLKPKCFADYQPNHAIDRACASCTVAAECQTGEQAEQEPVAWWNGRETAWFEHELDGHPAPDGCTIPLYAAPVRTKDLTDDEIHKCMNGNFYNALDFARAVIVADRELNK